MQMICVEYMVVKKKFVLGFVCGVYGSASNLIYTLSYISVFYQTFATPSLFFVSREISNNVFLHVKLSIKVFDNVSIPIFPSLL